MISYIRGELVDIQEDKIIVDVGGDMVSICQGRRLQDCRQQEEK